MAATSDALLVLNPYIPFPSTANRDRYLSLLRRVAQETLEKEPDCLAYCWTYPLGDANGSNESKIVVQGLEVYLNEDALAITHRNGMAYKEMRDSVTAEKLFTFPKGAIPMYKPAGDCFLSKAGAPETITLDDMFLMVQYAVPDTESSSGFVKAEQQLSKDLAMTKDVLSLWCFVDRHTDEMPSVGLFIRTSSVHSYENVVRNRLQEFE